MTPGVTQLNTDHLLRVCLLSLIQHLFFIHDVNEMALQYLSVCYSK